MVEAEPPAPNPDRESPNATAAAGERPRVSIEVVGAGTPCRGLDTRALLLLFLAALFIRIGFSQQVVRILPTQQELVMDAARYFSWAHEIAAGQWRPKAAFSQAPLYPYLLAGVIRCGWPGTGVAFRGTLCAISL